MKKTLLSLAVCASLAFGMGDKAANEITQADVDIQNALSDASVGQEPIDNMQEFFDQFENKHQITFGETKDGRTFYYGYADVSYNPKDPNFAKALFVAYNKAVLNLQTEFIKDAFGRTTTERLRQIEEDNSSNAREFEELPKGGALSQIWGKTKQWTGAKLDKALNDMGIQTQGLTEERKKELFLDNFLSKSMTQAFGDMSGLVPVETTLVQTENDNYRIGVIAVVSNKTREIARAIREKRAPNVTSAKGKSLEEFLPKNSKGFLNEYGIRLVYDETGAPMIISYGTWGYIPKVNSKATDRLETLSQDKAAAMADAAIVEFVNTSLNYANTEISGEIIKESIKETKDINTDNVELSEQELTSIIDKTSTKIIARASGDLRGIRPVKRWKATDENGVKYVGVVKVYSYANYLNTTEAINNSKNKANATTTSTTANKPEVAIKRKSASVNTVDDF